MLAGVARADDDWQMAAYGQDDEVPPSPDTDMASLTATDACDELAPVDATRDPRFVVTCDRLEVARVGSATARLYRVAERDRTIRSSDNATYFIVIDDGGTRRKSIPLAVLPNSKLCGMWTEPIDTDAHLRVLHHMGKPAVALELRVLNRANTVDTAYCKTNGYRTWRRTAFLVCGNGGTWSCSAASFGHWLYPPCIATLHDDGTLDYTCKHDDAFHFDR